VTVTSDGRYHTFTCNGDATEQVESFGYLGAVITSTGYCSVEINSRLVIARSALTSMNKLRKDRALNKDTKVRLMRVIVWPVTTYRCESWTFKASDKKRIAGFEMTAYRGMLRISWKDHRTNQSILEEVDTNARLLNDIQRRKLRYFGHVVIADNLCTSILHGRIAGTWKRGRLRRRWIELPVVECVRTAQDRTAWRATVLLAFAFDPQE